MTVRNRLMGGMATVAAAAGLLAGTIGVSADASGVVDVDAVVFTTSPVAAQVYWVAGGGNYIFTAAACAGASVDIGVPPAPDVEAAPAGACTVPGGSAGTFDSIVCGTGFAFGNPTSIQELPGDDGTYAVNNGPVVSALRHTSAGAYVVVFVAGTGILLADNVVDTEDGGTSIGVGVVQITPTGIIPPNPSAAPGPVWPDTLLGGNPSTAGLLGPCTNGFTVTAAIATTA